MQLEPESVESAPQVSEKHGAVDVGGDGVVAEQVGGADVAVDGEHPRSRLHRVQVDGRHVVGRQHPVLDRQGRVLHHQGRAVVGDRGGPHRALVIYLRAVHDHRGAGVIGDQRGAVADEVAAAVAVEADHRALERVAAAVDVDAVEALAGRGDPHAGGAGVGHLAADRRREHRVRADQAARVRVDGLAERVDVLLPGDVVGLGHGQDDVAAPAAGHEHGVRAAGGREHLAGLDAVDGHRQAVAGRSRQHAARLDRDGRDGGGGGDRVGLAGRHRDAVPGRRPSGPRRGGRGVRRGREQGHARRGGRGGRASSEQKGTSGHCAHALPFHRTFAVAWRAGGEFQVISITETSNCPPRAGTRQLPMAGIRVGDFSIAMVGC